MKIDTQIGSVGIKIDSKRIDKNILNAQKRLDEDVLNDTTYYIPKGSTGFLRGSGHIAPGGGEVIWSAVYSHFINTGFVRTDEYGRVFVKRYEEKPILTKRPLDFSGTPGAEREHFKAAKRDHFEEWLADVREEMGKG